MTRLRPPHHYQDVADEPTTIPGGSRASASSSGPRPKLPYCVVINGKDFSCFASKSVAESDAAALRRGHERRGFKSEVRVRTRTGFGGAMTKTRHGGGVDKTALHELELYIDNTSSLYRKRFMPILQNQCRKVKRGVWNEKLAAKGWLYLVDAGAQKYAREFSSSDTVGSGAWHRVFNMATRQALAKRYARATRQQCTEHGLAGLRRRR